MITHEPLPLYEAFSFLTGIANDFSIEEFFEAMYMKHISKAEEYGKRCRVEKRVPDHGPRGVRLRP